MSPLEVERIDRVPVVRVLGDIDTANAGAVQQQLGDVLGPEAVTLVVDLSRTGYLDSAGVDMLLRLGVRLGQRRTKLLLVIPDSSPLKRLAAIVGLPNVIATFDRLPDALRVAVDTASEPAPTPDAGQHADA